MMIHSMIQMNTVRLGRKKDCFMAPTLKLHVDKILQSTVLFKFQNIPAPNHKLNLQDNTEALSHVHTSIIRVQYVASFNCET